MPNVLFRPARTKQELNFVLKSWIRSFARVRRTQLSQKRFIEALRGSILDLLKRPGTNLQLACNPLNESQIWGFVCHESGYPWPVLHYVYVKELLRESGIGTELLSLARGTSPGTLRYTHKTPACKYLLPHAKHAPELARYQRREDVNENRSRPA